MSESTPTREEQLARMAAHMEERQKENAGADLKLDTQWWVPAINFGADIKVHFLYSYAKKKGIILFSLILLYLW